MPFAVFDVCRPDWKLTLCCSYLPLFTTTVCILNVGFVHAPSQTVHTNVLFTAVDLVPSGHVDIHLLLYNDRFAEHVLTHLLPSM